ncbi:basic salivary proline-rich protein 1-like [Panthera pardus]|uniref:Basic salivary proline-rich protein 1-like n=1 Tax=Panthera pardus TaxID=9691 RepID=A0A9W2V2K5_PANPR|nr:basic salivary proline-rich protein 1-like [Panthera pardus]
MKADHVPAEGQLHKPDAAKLNLGYSIFPFMRGCLMLGHIIAFWLLGTLDSTSALCLGAIRSSKNTNRKPPNEKHGAQKRPQGSSKSAHPGVPPQAGPSRARFSRTHRRAALGSPASGRPGPVGGGGGRGGGTAERAGRTPGARRRTGALAPALPHRLPRCTPTRTRGRRAPGRLRGGRERGSARNPWNEAPPARPQARSAGLRLARQNTPPGHAPPTEQVGGRAQVSRLGSGGGAPRARERLVSPPPSRRTPRGRSHLPRGRRRARAGDACCRPGAALGPRRRRQFPRARGPGISRISLPPKGPASGNSPSVYTHQRTFRGAQVPAALGQPASARVFEPDPQHLRGARFQTLTLPLPPAAAFGRVYDFSSARRSALTPGSPARPQRTRGTPVPGTRTWTAASLSRYPHTPATLPRQAGGHTYLQENVGCGYRLGFGSPASRGPSYLGEIYVGWDYGSQRVPRGPSLAARR